MPTEAPPTEVVLEPDARGAPPPPPLPPAVHFHDALIEVIEEIAPTLLPTAPPVDPVIVDGRPETIDGGDGRDGGGGAPSPAPAPAPPPVANVTVEMTNVSLSLFAGSSDALAATTLRVASNQVVLSPTALRGAGSSSTTLYLVDCMLRSARAISKPAMSSTWMRFTGFVEADGARRCASKRDRPGP